MKKGISMLLAVCMLVGMITISVAYAQTSAEVELTVEADKTQVNLGDEVTFSVYMKTDNPVAGIQVHIVLPEGMTYVPESGSVPSFWRDQLGFTEASFTEQTKVVAIAHYQQYTPTEQMKVAEFKCTADQGSVEGWNVSLDDTDVTDIDANSYSIEVVPATVKVRVAVTGMTLDQNSLSLNTGDNKTATLAAMVEPNEATDKAVIWESSDSAVAMVENGVVTAVKQGTATITAKTADGSFTDTCLVTVSCAHVNKTPVAAKTPTCQEGGWEAYETCQDCYKLFAADGTTEISAIPAIAKDPNNHTNIQSFEADPATCMHQGHDAYSKCMDCSVITFGSDAKYYSDHNYGTLHPAQDAIHTPTELKPAVAAYYQCSVCSQYFDENKVETTLAALIGITPTHSYNDWVTTDADQHWKECTCGKRVEATDHNYDNTCDTTCNTCGHTRAITHNLSTTWSDDGTNHWHECTVCHAARGDEGFHTGGTATCQAKKICTVCQKAYGDFAPCNFTETVDDQYLVSEATCIAKAVFRKSCSVCGTVHPTETFENGAFDANNHVGGTYADGKVDPTCIQEGHTGNIRCNSCHAVVRPDTVVPVIDHVPENEWSSDGTHHWKNCKTPGCDHKIDKVEHAGGTATCKDKAVCEACQAAYGGTNANNHVGGTYADGKVDPTCIQEGHTGNIRCNSCHVVVQPDTIVPVTDHIPKAEWSSDGTHHWKNCKTPGCDHKIDKVEHAGGTATCQNKAACTTCWAAYGEVDANNHVNENEIKNAKAATCTTDGYTGDTYCKGCGEKLQDGVVIPKGHKIVEVPTKEATHEAEGNIRYYFCSVCNLLFADAEGKTDIKAEDTVISKGEHDYGYVADAENHWKACACGSSIEKDAHKFGDWTVIKEATATVKGSKEKACSVCGYKVTEEIPLVENSEIPLVENSNPDSPQTGDNSNLPLLFVLLMISICGVVILPFLNKKRAR